VLLKSFSKKLLNELKIRLFDLLKENKFSSHSRVNVYFYELKSPNCKQLLNISEKGFFYKQGLDFHRPSNLYARQLGVKTTDPHGASSRGGPPV
jgi:hypothetical protein